MDWQFWKNRTYPIGVEVGASGVRMIQLRHGRAGWHVVAASEQIFAQPVTDDLSARQSTVQNSIALAKAKAPFEGSDCISCLATSDMLFRAVRLPQMTDDELTKAAAWEAADRFDAEVDDLQTFWIRAGEVTQGNEKRDEVILVAVPRVQVEGHLDALIANHLRPIAVDASFAAVTRSTCRTLRRESDLSTVQMLIDIGPKLSTVIVTRGNEFAFLKTVKVGGESFDGAVARALNMSQEEAWDLRTRRMQPQAENGAHATEDRVSRAVFEAIRPFMHDLAQEVALCLRYYSVTFRGARPTVVKIVGPNAAEPYLAEILTEHLKINTEVARPFSGINISKMNLRADRRESAHPEWATVLGLTLRGRSDTLVGGRTKAVAESTDEMSERREAA